MKEHEPMTAHRLIRQACVQRSKTQGELASSIGVSPKVLSEQLISGRIPFGRFSQILAELGYEVKVEPLGGGVPVEPQMRGISKDIRQMVDGVVYDTRKADAVCHTSEQSGWYNELYQDQEGRYFVVRNSLWNRENSYIRPCLEKEAKAMCLEQNRSKKNM